MNFYRIMQTTNILFPHKEKWRSNIPVHSGSSTPLFVVIVLIVLATWWQQTQVNTTLASHCQNYLHSSVSAEVNLATPPLYSGIVKKTLACLSF